MCKNIKDMQQILIFSFYSHFLFTYIKNMTVSSLSQERNNHSVFVAVCGPRRFNHSDTQSPCHL